jgi:large subunit ribosomal protein L21
MYAIFEAKGKQFRAEPDMTLVLPSLDAEPGERVTFDHVLLAERDEQVIIGQPSLEGASVATEVVRHGRGEKIIVFKMKRRKGYRRKQGHRQGFTEIRIVDIDLGTGRSVERPAKVEKPKRKKAVEAEAAKKPAKAKKVAEKVEKAEAPVVEVEQVEVEAPVVEVEQVEAEAPDVEAEPAVVEAPTEEPSAVDATDTARSLAEENGIDLSTLEGSGKGGRILKSDVAKVIKAREGK